MFCDSDWVLISKKQTKNDKHAICSQNIVKTLFCAKNTVLFFGRITYRFNRGLISLTPISLQMPWIYLSANECDVKDSNLYWFVSPGERVDKWRKVRKFGKQKKN